MFSLFSEIKEAVEDEQSRSRAIIAIVLSCIVMLVIVIWLMYQILASDGCNANPSTVGLIGSGFVALLWGLIACFFGGYVIYGGLWLPKVISNWWTKHQSWDARKARIDFAARLRIEEGAPIVRFFKGLKNFFFTYWKHILAGAACLVAALFLCYMVAYICWSIFC